MGGVEGSWKATLYFQVWGPVSAQDPACLVWTAACSEAHAKLLLLFPPHSSYHFDFFSLIPQQASWNMFMKLIHLQC